MTTNNNSKCPCNRHKYTQIHSKYIQTENIKPRANKSESYLYNDMELCEQIKQRYMGMHILELNPKQYFE